MSLRTDSRKTAIKRHPFAAAEIEARFEKARNELGLDFDAAVASSVAVGLARSAKATGTLVATTTFADAYEQYLKDPTHTWSDSTRQAYETTHKIATSVFGFDTPVRSIARTHAREFIDVLRHLPRNSGKRFPDLAPREAAKLMRERGDRSIISSANANAYIGNLSTFLNWAVNEEIIDRNPMRGLRLPDEIAKRDKRYPSSAAQLKTLFNAPLYGGCANGERGYSTPGAERPRNARFWIPLIALFSGMRLNEICQLDVTDIRTIDDIVCMLITTASLVGSTDKRLKTGASDRIVPLHQRLIELGLPAYAKAQQRAGHTKIFHEVDPGPGGIRAVSFSKWFTHFQRSAGASRERTSFHSFRHNYRDALRIARIDHDIAMALGGWTSGSSKTGVSENYGSGYPVAVLKQAVDRLAFPELDLRI